MAAQTILIAEDDPDIRDGVRILLSGEGYHILEAENGTRALEIFNPEVDLVILDIMMPGMSGLRVCEELRKVSTVPILFLTARLDEPSVLEGLGIGADDYLPKPFRVAELRARVAAHLRRQNRAPARRMERSGVCFDLAGRSAAVGGQLLPLTRSEYAICEHLALHAGQTFTKEQIYEAVFGVDGTSDDTAITQHIKNIRAKLRAAGIAAPEVLLKTVWGVGYQWKNED